MRKFLLSFFNKQGAEFSGINRWIAKSFNEVGDSADMVKMAVGDNQSPNFAPVFLKIFDVRQNIINSGGLAVAELNTGVNDDNVVFVFNDHHIFADFLNSSQRNYPEIFSRRRNFYGLAFIHRSATLSHSGRTRAGDTSSLSVSLSRPSHQGHSRAPFYSLLHFNCVLRID